MMRSFVSLYLLLATVVILTAGFVMLAHDAHHPAEQADLVLPIEVMHYDVFGEHAGNNELPFHGSDSPRHVKSVTFDVSGSPGELWLWGHQIGFQYFWDHFEWQQGAGDVIDSNINSDYDAPYDGRAKASVRINGGSWIDIKNDNVTCASPEEEQFCIGGIAGAMRFKVNGSQLQSGSNTVEFAFLGHEMLSSGYRILDIVALPAGYSGSLSHRDVRPVDLITNNKVMDHLDTEAPSGSDAQAGETLWHAENSLIDFPGGPEIIASCNDCHAQDGRDLEFFGYSNESITVRSMHHGLTQQEGENIAAYIRSQDLTFEDGTSYSWRSRPWQPPYQPGLAGFGPNNEHPDVADAQFWSAGAGLEWVADDDVEGLPYVFSDGTGDPQAGPFVDPPNLQFQSTILRAGNSKDLNLREYPLDTQLPDWNRWLPIIHPKDAYGETGFYTAEHTGRNPWNEYQSRRSEGVNITPLWMGRTAGITYQAYKDLPVIDESSAWNTEESRARRGLQQWNAVKQWELHHEFYHEDRPARGDLNREPRSWIGGSRPTFNVASHIGGNQSTMDGPPVGKAGEAFSHLWYHLQMLQSSSELDMSGQSPIDWNYQTMFLSAFVSATGLGGSVRAITTQAQKDQRMYETNVLDVNKGFNSHRHGMYQFWRMVDRGNFADLSQSDQDALVNSYLSAWVWLVRQHDVSEFPRSGDPDDCVQVERNSWGHPDHRPRVRSLTGHGCDNQANNHYNGIRWYADNMSISPSTLDSLARWGSEMWGDPVDGAPPWETWFIGQGAGGVSLNVSGDETPAPAPANFTLTAEINEAEFDPTLVEIYIDDMLFAEVEDAPFEVAWEGVQEGSYAVVAQAYAADGTSLTSPAVTVEVSAPVDEPEDDDPSSVPVGPTGFVSADVGPVGVPGTVSFEAGQYAVSGSGADIWNEHDAYHFAHQEVSGDGVITARLTSQENTDPWAKAGVMIRESLASDAAHAMVVGTPESGARLQHRAEVGSGSEDMGLDDSAESPVWLRLEREGSLLTGMISYDGQTWESEHSVTIDLPETVVVGLAVTSHDNTALSTATFEDVSLSWLGEAAEQVLALDAGWNMVARHVEPANADLEVLWEAIGDTLVLVKNAAGANYFPEFGINEIGAWQPDEAYMVFVTDPVDFTIAGDQLPLEQRTVELSEGWSYAPYRGTAPLEAEEAFAGLSSLLLVVDQEGGVYFPEQGLNTIGALLPGRGYRVFMMAAEAWVLPDAADAPDAPSLIVEQQAQSRLSPSASVLLLDAPSLPSGRQVDVLTADSMVVGTGVVEQGRAAIVVAAEEELVASGTGAQTGQQLVLRTGYQTLPVVQVQDVLSGGGSETLTFAPNTVLHVHLGTVAQEVALHQSYPNPARRAVTVPLEVPVEGPVRLLLYDALGRQVRTLVDGPLAPGRHEVQVDVSDLASGVYHYRLRAGDAHASGRMTVVR